MDILSLLSILICHFYLFELWLSVPVNSFGHGGTYLSFRNKIIKFDPLEAIQTLKRIQYGLYCAISGNEPSSVALFEPAKKARLLSPAISKIYTRSLNQRQIPKRNQII